MVAALDSVSLITDALIGAGIGALVGSVVAQGHQRRGGLLPHDWIVTRWSVLFAVGIPLLARLSDVS